MGPITGNIYLIYCKLTNNNIRSTYMKQNDICNRRKRQLGGGGIMLWGMVLPVGLIAVKELNGKVNSEKYIRLLETFAVPCMKLNLNRGFNFVQDNAPIHSSKKTTTFLSNEMFSVLKWPALSPDINIMENIWKMMSDIIYNHNQPQNKEELKRKIDDAVLIINTERRETIVGLYKGFRKRLTTLLVKGGNIIN